MSTFSHHPTKKGKWLSSNAFLARHLGGSFALCPAKKDWNTIEDSCSAAVPIGMADQMHRIVSNRSCFRLGADTAPTQPTLYVNPLWQ